MSLKNLVSFVVLFFSLNLKAQVQEQDPQVVLNAINTQIKIITASESLKGQVDIEKLLENIENNVNNVDELIRIKKELGIVIDKEPGTICIC